MTVNQNDLDSFHRFATHQLAQAGRDLTLEDLISQRNAQWEHANTVASIRRGLADAEAGRVHDLNEVDAKIRAELGFLTRRR
jgi:predicted transcriptional regulator